MHPAPLQGKFIVEFHGKYIPLQGVEFIIQAAKLLESDTNIQFVLIGNGQTYAKNRALADYLQVKNIQFIDKVSYEEIPKFIAEGGVCLGIFGKSDKTQRVIPNKIYEAIALGKPVITARTPAIKEVFIDFENIILCEAANAQDLAFKIKALKGDEELRKKISHNVSLLYQTRLTPKYIVEDLVETLSAVKK